MDSDEKNDPNCATRKEEEAARADFRRREEGLLSVSDAAHRANAAVMAATHK
jgi:hypothetical protein